MFPCLLLFYQCDQWYQWYQCWCYQTVVSQPVSPLAGTGGWLLLLLLSTPGAPPANTGPGQADTHSVTRHHAPLVLSHSPDQSVGPGLFTLNTTHYTRYQISEITVTQPVARDIYTQDQHLGMGPC